MPQVFNPAVMTNAGIDLLNRAQAGLASIEFTKMVVGNGAYSDAEKTVASLQSRTALKSPKNNYPLSDVDIISNNAVKISALIANQDPVTMQVLVSNGYYINEIGLYAKVRNGAASTEVLYSIAVVNGQNGDYMPPYNGYNPAHIVQDFIATVDNATNVSINVSGAAVLVEDKYKIRDDTTRKKYKFGIDNGAIYFEEVAE